MSRDGGSGYRAYVFEESTRRCAIDRKGRGRKEVIYLRVADVSCTRGVRESTGPPYGGPCGGVPWQNYIEYGYRISLLISILIIYIYIKKVLF